jgi:hypothetical protein
LAANPAPEESGLAVRGVSFAEHCENFAGVDFGVGNKWRGRILWALYSIRVHTLEELGNQTAIKKLCEKRGIGPKTFEQIRSALCR